MADGDQLDPDDDGKPLVLAPSTIFVGLLERLMIHECVTPQDHRNWNKSDSLTAMRYIRQVVENRTLARKPFGLTAGASMADAEMAAIKKPGQFGGFSKAPNFAIGYMDNVDLILRYANDPKDPRRNRNRAQVRNAIKAATEALISANLVVPRLYYWLAKGVPGPGARAHPYTTIQGNTFYTQDNLP